MERTNDRHPLGLHLSRVTEWVLYAIGGLATIGLLSLSNVWTQTCLYCLSVGIVVWTTRRRDPGQRRAWYLIAAGLTAFSVADIIWNIFELYGQQVPSFPAPMDAMYLAGYPLVAAGLFLLSRVDGVRPGDNIDSAIITIGLGAVSWVFLGAPFLSAPGYSGLQLATALAYPAGDALLLGAVVSIVLSGIRGASVRWLIVTAGLIVVTDGIYLHQSFLGSYSAGGWLDIGWLLSYVAIALASLQLAPLRSANTGDHRRLSVGRLSFPILLATVGPALFSAQLIAGVQVNRFVIGGSVAVLIVLALARARGVVSSFNKQLARLDEQKVSLEFQARVLDEIESFVVVVGSDARLSYWNAYAGQYFGWSDEDARERLWSDVFGGLDADEIAGVSAGLLESGTWEGDIAIPGKSESRVVSVAVSQMHDETGTQVATICIGHDVTQGRELEDRLRRVQKLEAFGQLAGGVAHDFNNLLAVVVNYAKFLVDDLPEGDSRREDALEIVNAGERGARLTRQLLTFSRKNVVKPEVLQLNDVVREMSKMLSRTIPENVRFSIELTDDLSSIRIDPGHMEQIIMNLVVNARDAMPDGGNMKLRTSTTSIESADAARLGITAGRYVTFSVGDEGVGMDEHTQARIFEPFFTTKEVGKGTGLGLATVYGIIQEATGAIDVKSVPGEGSEFTVYLPFHQSEEMEGDPDLVIEPPLRGNGERIIVTEDEQAVRELVCRILRRNGYVVMPYSSGEEAAADIESGRVSADMLLTDVVMPGLSGPDLALRAGLPTLLMSGYSNLDPERVGAWPTLAKPFGEAQLARAVRSVLKDASSRATTRPRV